MPGIVLVVSDNGILVVQLLPALIGCGIVPVRTLEAKTSEGKSSSLSSTLRYGNMLALWRALNCLLVSFFSLVVYLLIIHFLIGARVLARGPKYTAHLVRKVHDCRSMSYHDTQMRFLGILGKTGVVQLVPSVGTGLHPVSVDTWLINYI